jgi:hypothetical protein
MDYDVGYFDDTECRLEPLDNALGAKLLPMSQERQARYLNEMLGSHFATAFLSKHCGWVLGYTWKLDALKLVSWQVVHNDDVALFKCGCQELLRPAPEGLVIHRTVQRHGCGETVVAKCREEGGCAPVALRRFHQEPVTDRTAAAAATMWNQISDDLGKSIPIQSTRELL